MKNIDLWIKDFDLLDENYIENPFEYLTAVSERGPIVKSSNPDLTWMTTSYKELTEICQDYNTFSSAQGIRIVQSGLDEHQSLAIPLTADPPLHTEAKRLITRWLTPKKVEEYKSVTKNICTKLIDNFIENRTVDAADSYARYIPSEIIADILSIDNKDVVKFTNWVNAILANSSDPESLSIARRELSIFLFQNVLKFKENPQDNFISSLFDSEFNEIQITGICASLFVAGIDTTWSSIGTILWHFASNPEHLKYFKENIENRYFVIEELLRYYSPVLVSRTITKDTEFGGCPMKAGEKIVLNYTAANRDPLVFDNPDTVILDRKNNRHIAFGSGIHRCIGANLARMEIMVALETWIDRIPEFTLDENIPVAWVGGQVRGPRKLMINF